MRKPKRRGTELSEARFEEWIERFSAFRDAISPGKIERWLARFDEEERDIAARILDCVEVISNQQIRAAFRRILQDLPGWADHEEARRGRWFFVARETSAGESGGTMLNVFRNANGMSSSKFNHLFRYVRDLPGLGLGPDDNVVFIDDFSGTGDQVCDDWKVLKEIVAGKPNLLLVLMAIPADTLQRIEDETDYRVQSDILVSEQDNIFSPKCKHFNAREKYIIEKYCRKASKGAPRGYGDRGLLLVFHHGCPNNSIPILHANKRAWVGLFPRYDFESRMRT